MSYIFTLGWLKGTKEWLKGTKGWLKGTKGWLKGTPLDCKCISHAKNKHACMFICFAWDIHLNKYLTLTFTWCIIFDTNYMSILCKKLWNQEVMRNLWTNINDWSNRPPSTAIITLGRMFVLQINLWCEVQRNIHDIVWQSFIIRQTIIIWWRSTIKMLKIF